MKKILFFALAIALAAIVSSCCSSCRQRRVNAKPLVGTEWHLMQMDGVEVNADADTFNISFSADGKISGIGSCNRLMGNYTVTDKRALTLSQFASTRAMCPRQKEESRMLEILSDATHYDIDYDMLIILQDGVQKAVFRAK